MPTSSFEGKAARVAQVTTYTVETSPSDGEVFSIGFDHPSGGLGSAGAIIIATDTAASDTGTTVATELTAQINASKHPFVYGYTGQRGGVTASSSGAVITITAKYPGVPFISAVGSTTTGTLTKTATTANSGPNDISVPGNYYGGASPVDADSIIYTGDSDLLYGFQICVAALDATDITFKMGCAQIGWPEAPFLLNVGETAAGVVQFQCPNAKAYIQSIDVSVDDFVVLDARCLHLQGAVTTTNLLVRRGNVYLAWHKGETITVTNSYVFPSGALYAGPGCTHTNIYQVGGRLETHSIAAVTLFETAEGSALLNCSGTWTAIRQDSGLVDIRGNSVAAFVATTYNGYGGLLQLGNSKNARTLSTLNEHAELSVIDPDNNVTVTTRNVFGRKRQTAGGYDSGKFGGESAPGGGYG